MLPPDERETHLPSSSSSTMRCLYSCRASCIPFREMFTRIAPLFAFQYLSPSLSLLFFARSPGGMDDPLRTFVWRYSAFMSFFLCRTIWSIFSTQWFLLSAASTVCTACRPLPPCACLARFLLPTRCARPPSASLNFIHHLRPTKNAQRN